ncbi:TetR/AcrR family transcriptional regulator [Streptosporangium sp. NPDC049376]|uniref:TetR/AcrR family transcriptional regulator n=1 Tax=Streptosporangium sp. NPDC049376 TaxID=3366192 RepID=UPI0037ABE15F
MARPNARPAMIEAALRVVEERGITALTLDAVAAEAGVTKRGLIYHFPTKHALLAGIHEFLADRVERGLREATGKEPEEATLAERTRGYVLACTGASTRLETRLIAEAGNEPDWMAPWQRVYDRWFPGDAAPIDENDDEAMRCLMARMAADGFWGYENALGASLPTGVRKRLVDEILALIPEPPAP